MATFFHPLFKHLGQLDLASGMPRLRGWKAHRQRDVFLGKPVTVVIRDVLAASARDVGEAVEAAASAFAADAGGFSQMEIVLCGWNEDIESVLQIENYSWVLMTYPWERLQANSFSSLSRWDAKGGQRPAGHEWAGRLSGHEESMLTLVDASLGARFRQGRQYRRSLIRRPDLAL
jgi:hypothetical protein